MTDVMLPVPSNTVLKDHLLEVGWNNSESTQRDVEKSLNCCGFKHVDPNSICDAVSLDQVFPSVSCSPLHVTYLSMCIEADDGTVFFECTIKLNTSPIFK